MYSAMNATLRMAGAECATSSSVLSLTGAGFELKPRAEVLFSLLGVIG